MRMTIKQYIKWLTDYRDNLIISFHELLVLEEFTDDHVAKFISEIQLCNRYIDYLHAWDNYYNGPIIPSDNQEIINAVEMFTKE